MPSFINSSKKLFVGCKMAHYVFSDSEHDFSFKRNDRTSRRMKSMKWLACRILPGMAFTFNEFGTD
jgi:hypothetical protein